MLKKKNLIYLKGMIKLILTDLDGTLLSSDKKIPEELPEVYNKLKEQGITFGIASGRSYASIRRDFPNIAPDTLVISDGGSLVTYKDQLVHQIIFNQKEYQRVIKQVLQIPNSFTIACTRDCAYTLPLEKEHYFNEVHKFHSKHIIVDDLLSLDNIIKVSVFLDDKNTGRALEMSADLEDYNEVVLGGDEWLDVCVKNTSKASGIKPACALLNIEKEQIMAFGDYLNDLELLKNIDYSYAMDNAHPDIHKVANYKCASNDENGVMNEIIKKFNLDIIT